jgi:guanylate kinase
MKRLFVFVGDGGSGKTTLISELVKCYPDAFRKVVTCTSRLPRTGEVNGIDYHFLPKSYFFDNPDLVFVKQTADRNFYGTRRADLRSDTHHLLLTLRFSGIQKLKTLNLENVVLVHISIDEGLKAERMRQRGDTEEMIVRRMQYDNTDRVGFDLQEFLVINLCATNSLSEEVAQILKAS